MLSRVLHVERLVNPLHLVGQPHDDVILEPTHLSGQPHVHVQPIGLRAVVLAPGPTQQLYSSGYLGVALLLRGGHVVGVYHVEVRHKVCEWLLQLLKHNMQPIYRGGTYELLC